MAKPFNKSFRGRGSHNNNNRGGTFRGGRGGGRGGRGGGGINSNHGGGGPPVLSTEQEGTKEGDRLEEGKEWDELDERLGFGKYMEGGKRVGWLVNMMQVSFYLSPPFPSLPSHLFLGREEREMEMGKRLMEFGRGNV
jgi:DNA polymerase epsilon subunit 1